LKRSILIETEDWFSSSFSFQGTRIKTEHREIKRTGKSKNEDTEPNGKLQRWNCSSSIYYFFPSPFQSFSVLPELLCVFTFPFSTITHNTLLKKIENNGIKEA